MLNEQQLEDLCINWFQQIGWQFVHGPDIAPDSDRPERADYREVILRDRLMAALARINPHVPDHELDQAIHALKTVSEPMLVGRNRAVHRLLLNGVGVSFAKADGDGNGKKTDLVSLIDFANPSNNEFLVVNQFTVAGAKQPRRPDLVVFVNGLPLAVLELKNPANEQTDIWDAFNQLQTYKDEITDLFNCNAALVISDGLTARLGSLTADAERMLPWRTIANENDRPQLQMELETLVRGFFKPELFLDYVRHFVLFEQDGDTIIKKVAGYHQFHAVREAVHATVIAAQDADKGLLEVREERATYGKEVKPGSRKAGVVWHTQGSGKSITMACFAGKLLQQPAMKNPTLVVVTDRNDLDGQLFGTFCAASDLLRTTPVQAADRDDLREMLASREAGGIIFTTVQKFALLEDEDKPNIGLLSDEFLEDVRQMKTKNLAVELLEKLLRDEIKARTRSNVVQEKKYGDRLLDTLRKYNNRAIEAAQVIEELIQMAKEFQAVLEREAALGLSSDEIAFYDALANNESAVRLLGDETLKKIAVEITEKLRASTSVDWQVRESVRARLRILVRRTLQKWKYPPDRQDDAVELVLKQAETLSNEWSK